MTIVNSVLRVLFDAVLYPFRGLPAIVGLGVVSLLTSIGMLIVFKATSNQEKLAAVKRGVHACFFEIRLFNDDLRAILAAQGRMLRLNLTYLRLSLVPMLWMILPLALVIAHLEFHYAYQGLRPGSTALVKVELKKDGMQGEAAGTPGRPRPAVTLTAPDGLRVETPPVWIPSLGEMVWRIAADRPGDYQMTVGFGVETETKSVRVSGEVVRRSPVRVGPGLLDQILYPAEPPLPAASAIQAIRLTYPDADIVVLGRGFHWLLVFFALSMVFAFALRKRFKVTI
jgi:uncharacterized membrane protein (DUF106 family)